MAVLAATILLKRSVGMDRMLVIFFACMSNSSLKASLVTAISRSFPNVCPGTIFLSFPGKPVPSRCPVKIFEKGQTTDTYGQN